MVDLVGAYTDLSRGDNLMLICLFSQFRALKFLMAAPKNSGNEGAVLSRLSRQSNHPGRKHVLHLHDRFSIQGPNGLHEVLVTDVAGSNLKNIVEHCFDMTARYADRLPLPHLKRLISELLLALDYLRLCDVVHGG